MIRNLSDQSQDFIAGVRDVTPLAFGVAIYGLAFGLLAAQAGMDGMQTGVMGAVVFAGSSQIVAVERIVAGAGAYAALIAGIALNLRIFLITASLRSEFKERPLWQMLLGVHLAGDENWALLHAKRAGGGKAGYWYLVGAGLCLMLVWLLTTVSGASFAQALPEPRALGLDFAFAAAFIAILRSLCRRASDVLPWGFSIAASATLVLLTPIEPSWALALGGALGAGVAGVWSHA